MNDWNEKFQYSSGQQQIFDMELLKNHIPKCTRIVKTDTEKDKAGIDYIAYLEDGAEIYIDAKTRMPGCSKYWRSGPELALEMWSVKERKVIGWTLSTKSQVDYILYTFPKKDCKYYYFIPFQSLRKVFQKCGKEWLKKYGSHLQKNKTYHSEAIFVPANVVINAIKDTMRGEAMQ